jgi:hypothetical protein
MAKLISNFELPEFSYPDTRETLESMKNYREEMYYHIYERPKKISSEEFNASVRPNQYRGEMYERIYGSEKMAAETEKAFGHLKPKRLKWICSEAHTCGQDECMHSKPHVHDDEDCENTFCGFRLIQTSGCKRYKGETPEVKRDRNKCISLWEE